MARMGAPLLIPPSCRMSGHQSRFTAQTHLRINGDCLIAPCLSSRVPSASRQTATHEAFNRITVDLVESDRMLSR